MKILFFFILAMLLACLAGIFFIDMSVLEWAIAQQFDQNPLVKILRRLGEGRDIVLSLMILFGLYALWQIFRPQRSEKIKRAAVNLGFIGAAVTLSGIVVNALKILFGRPRPQLYLNEGLYEFQWIQFERLMHSLPSGHASSETALLIALALLWPRYRVLLGVLLIIWLPTSFLIQAHWFSDVVLGALVAFCVTLWLHRCLIRSRKFAQYLRH